MFEYRESFYNLLERYGNRQFMCGKYQNNKTKTGIENYCKNLRGSERDKEKLISMWEEMNERINGNRKRV